MLRDVGDEQLVYRVAGGDDRALSELYDRYSRPVYATGVRLLRDVSLAEELVQDAFTNVWRRAGTFDPERASFATWLYRITRNRVVDLARKFRYSQFLRKHSAYASCVGGRLVPCSRCR